MLEARIKLENLLELNVRYSEANDKPTLLLLHFSGGTSRMWDGVIPLLKDEYRIIAPDLRGHGKSDRPITGYHIDQFAHDLYLLLQELGIRTCHVIGSSMGAEIGLSLAVSHPDLVLSLVCEGAIYNEFGEFGIFNGSDEEMTAEKNSLLTQLESRKLPVYQSKTDFIEEAKAPLVEQGIWNDHFLSFFESCMEDLADGCFVHFYKNHVRTEYIQKYWDLKFEEYYKRVTCPILFLPSQEEWSDPKIRHSLHYFASLVDDNEIYTIADSIHAYVWMQLPDKAIEVVKSFINKVKIGEEQV
jgi:pimeloyl-ACP methyl ester carboxylesterase